MKNFVAGLLAVLVISVFAESSRAALVLAYDIQDPVADIEVAAAGAGVVASTFSGGQLFGLSGLDSTTATSNLQLTSWDSGDFFEFGFSSSQAWDLERLQFATAGSGHLYNVSAFVNGSASSIEIASNVNVADNAGFDDYDLSAISGFTDITSATFQIVAANSVGGGFFLAGDASFVPSGAVAPANMSIDGSLSAVPEPNSICLMGLLGATLLVRRRRE